MTNAVTNAAPFFERVEAQWTATDSFIMAFIIGIIIFLFMHGIALDSINRRLKK